MDRLARPAITTRALTSPRTVDFLKSFDQNLAPYADTIAVREFRDHLRTELAA
ncbi:hypothetical protein ABZT47_00935 [Sphaerisporangium sp. NPDC005289]|uniref:hypothetical protein n=1 Tax=Sphaerisporangium sp. NPDC005289 TaxID=3155247 RepID=UPI0033B9A1E1